MGKTIELAIPPGRSNAGPRFTVRVRMVDSRRKDVAIDDDDFGYDAMIEITGDFLHEDKVRYATAVCAALNTANIPVRDDSQADGGSEHGK